jgi:hypothetical protein
MRARAILIAAAVLVVALGAGAVWVAAKDDDSPSSNAFSSADDASGQSDQPAPESTAPAPTTPPQETTPDQPAPPTTTETAPDQSLSTGPGSSTEPTSPTPRPKRETHFKREPKGADRNDQPDRKFVVPPAHEFTGEGNAHLGTVDVKTASVLKWRTKGRFEVRFGREEFPIIAPSSTGQLVLPPFLFTKVRVVAAGRWRITISPQ